jgi:hypothetical protein
MEQKEYEQFTVFHMTSKNAVPVSILLIKLKVFLEKNTYSIYDIHVNIMLAQNMLKNN